MGVKVAGAWGWRPTTLVVPNVKKSGVLIYPDPLGPSRRHVVGETFTFIFTSPILTAWYHFTWRAPFLGALMSRPTIKLTQVFMWSAPIFRPIINKSGFSRQILQKVTNINIIGYIGIKYNLTKLSIRLLSKCIFNHISQLHVSARPSAAIFRLNFFRG